MTQRLSTEQADDGHPGYMTVRDVARIYGTTTAYVYKLANQKRWRRYTLDGRVRYHVDDVDEALGKSVARPKVATS